MAFNSYLYLIGFLSLCTLLYYLCPKKGRWLVLLVFSASYYFFCSRKTILFLLGTILWVFFTGIILEKIQARGLKRMANAAPEDKKQLKKVLKRQKKLFLALALAVLFGLLVFLKYYGFFSDNINRLFPELFPALKLTIPLGISFYTLQAAGYLIDLYRGKYKACKNPFHFSLFLCFFPQIVEGPIGRYDRLAPQLIKGHSFDGGNMTAGLRHIAFGLLLKIVIADRAAIVVNTVFDDFKAYSGIAVILAILLYTLQLYAEFMGCMEIVRGSAFLFGIQLDANFRQPFRAASVNEFWQRWHITLGNWIRDYIFYPVSLSAPLKKLSKKLPGWLPSYYKKMIPVAIALFFVWLFNGLWHGSSWHYIFYGLYYYGCMALGMFLEPLSSRLCKALHIQRNAKGWHYFQVCRTFILVNIGMLIFRGNGLRAAAHMFLSIFTGFDLSSLTDQSLLVLGLDLKDYIILGAGVLIMGLTGHLQKGGVSIHGRLAALPLPLRWSIYYAVFFIILIFGAYGRGYAPVDFIYAQF